MTNPGEDPQFIWDDAVGGGDFTEEDTTAEAVILGPVVPFGPLVPYDAGELARIGGIVPQLVYVNAATAAELVPTRIPKKSGVTPGHLTPYESFVLSVVDGQASVGDIQRAGLLSRSEIITVIYGLRSRGLIELQEPTREPEAQSMALAVEARLQAKQDADLATTIDDDEAIAAAERDLATTIEDDEDSKLAAVRVLAASPKPTLVATAVSPSAVEFIELSASDLEPVEDSTSSAPAVKLPQRRRASPPPLPAPTTRGPAIQWQVSEEPSGLIPIVAAQRPQAGAASTDDALSRSTSLFKAKQLHRAALADAQRGDDVSAKMNLKLALAFDPSNQTYQHALAKLVEERRSTASVAPRPLSARAQRAYDEGCAQEMRGEIDDAVRSFEDSLLHGESPMVLNRLGVLLAMKRQDFACAEALLRRAVQLAPTSAVYAHNLAKIAASRTAEPGKRAAPPVVPGPTKVARRVSIFRRLFGRSPS